MNYNPGGRKTHSIQVPPRITLVDGEVVKDINYLSIRQGHYDSDRAVRTLLRDAAFVNDPRVADALRELQELTETTSPVEAFLRVVRPYLDQSGTAPEAHHQYW